MKDKKLWRKPYYKLIRKVFVQVLLLAFLSCLAILLIRSLGRGYIGNMITKGIVRFYQVDWNAAKYIYYDTVRQNIDYIILGTMIIFFLLLVRLLLSWFTKYFDEIIGGVNALASGEKRQIVMSPELGFVSAQLNKVNDELIHSAEAKREAEKRKNDLVVYLAHDIKTPLTSVIGYLSLLDESPQLPADQRQKYIQIALTKAQRLECLVSEFFEITRYNLQDVPLQKKSINLSYMMEQIVDEAYPQLSKNGKTAAINIPEELTVYADSDKLARVFNNIFKNAIAYSEAGSVIEISGEPDKENTVIHFKNEGAIPRSELDTIFEKFYRLDDARQTATGNAGLGLAIAKDIVALHGGTITAGSHKNQTVFTVMLPNL